MNTTYWLWGEISYRLYKGKIPQIWNKKEQGWQLSNTLMGLIVEGDPTLDQVTASVVEEKAPGSTKPNAEIINITEYPVP